MPLGRSFNRFLHRQLRRGDYWMRLGVLAQYPPRPLRLGTNLPMVSDSDRGVQWPTITIVTPSFNQAAFLERTLKSIINQKYPVLEYFVLDGGSTDGSVAILQQMDSQLSGWVSEPDEGQADAINRGFARGTGEIMAWINSDDVLLPGTLHFVGRFFAEHPDVDVVFGHRINIDEDDREVGRWIVPAYKDGDFQWADYVPQETLFWRRSALKGAPPCDPSFHFALDWDLLLRLRRNGARFRRLPYFMGCFRLHTAQKTQCFNECIGRSDSERLRIREHGYNPSDEEISEATLNFKWRAMLTSRLLECGIRI